MARIKIIALVLFVMIGAAAGYYFLGHGKEQIRNVASSVATKGKIEAATEEAVKTPVHVEGLKLTLESQEGRAGHLTIDNPKGFADAPAMKLGNVQFELDKDSLAGSGPLLIRMLAINEADISYEKNDAGSNLKQLAKSAGASAAAALQDKTGAGNRAVMIDNVYIRNITVTAAGEKDKPAKTATLRMVHLSNIGRAEGGVAPAKAAEAIIAAVAEAADNAATQALATN